MALAQLDLLQLERIGLDLDEACAVLDSLPDLSKPLAKADPEPSYRAGPNVNPVVPLKCSCVKDQKCSALQVIKLLQQTLELLRIIFSCKMMARER